MTIERNGRMVELRVLIDGADVPDMADEIARLQGQVDLLAQWLCVAHDDIAEEQSQRIALETRLADLSEHVASLVQAMNASCTVGSVLGERPVSIARRRRAPRVYRDVATEERWRRLKFA